MEVRLTLKNFEGQVDLDQLEGQADLDQLEGQAEGQVGGEGGFEQGHTGI